MVSLNVNVNSPFIVHHQRCYYDARHCQGVRKKKIGDTMLYFSVKATRGPPSLPPPSKKGNYGSIRARPGLCGLCYVCRTAVNVLLSPHHLRLLRPNLYPTFFLHFTHLLLLVTSFNYLEISIQLTVKAHPRAE